MAQKRFRFVFPRGRSLEAVVRQVSTGKFLDPNTGSFMASFSGGLPMTEDAVLLGLYSASEDRETWDSGEYEVFFTEGDRILKAAPLSVSRDEEVVSSAIYEVSVESFVTTGTGNSGSAALLNELRAQMRQVLSKLMVIEREVYNRAQGRS